MVHLTQSSNPVKIIIKSPTSDVLKYISQQIHIKLSERTFY